MAEVHAIDMNKWATSRNRPFDASFRMIVAYSPGTDEFIFRFDAKDGSKRESGIYKQFCSGFNCNHPPDQKGINIQATKYLFTPNTGVENCINIVANKDELLRALKELVADLEGTSTNG